MLSRAEVLSFEGPQLRLMAQGPCPLLCDSSSAPPEQRLSLFLSLGEGVGGAVVNIF